MRGTSNGPGVARPMPRKRPSPPPRQQRRHHRRERVGDRPDVDAAERMLFLVKDGAAEIHDDGVRATPKST